MVSCSCIHTYIQFAYMYTCIQKIPAYMHECTYNTRTFMLTCIHTCVHTFMHAYMHTHTYIHTYIYAQMHAHILVLSLCAIIYGYDMPVCACTWYQYYGCAVYTYTYARCQYYRVLLVLLSLPVIIVHFRRCHDCWYIYTCVCVCVCACVYVHYMRNMHILGLCMCVYIYTHIRMHMPYTQMMHLETCECSYLRSHM
jgi:hypothetical protein